MMKTLKNLDVKMHEFRTHVFYSENFSQVSLLLTLTSGGICNTTKYEIILVQPGGNL
jgi:hypothetical protein